MKYTFDVAREAPETTARFRLSARKEWWTNIASIEAPEPYTVVFHLKRPQPSLPSCSPPATRRCCPPTSP